MPASSRPPPTVRPFPTAGPSAAGTLTVCAIVFRLIAKGRSRSALAVLAAWAGATAAGTAILASGSGWAGIAYGAGRVAPALRAPLLTLWLSGAVIGDRRHRAVVGLVRAVVATTGAVVGVAFVEAVAPHWRRVAGPSPRVAVVVNTDSGSARVAGRALRALALEPVEFMSVEKVRAPELSAALARASARLAGRGRLVAAGGDGTIGTVADWAAQSGLELAVLPTGTGNDIARSIGIPLYPEEAAAVVARGQVRRVDLVQTNLGGFAHAAGIGMVAEFAAATCDTRGWRRPLVYPYRSWQAWHHRRPLRVEVTVDGDMVTFPSPPFEIAVVNAPRVGGRIGLRLPGARADDGLVDVIALYQGVGRHAIRGLAHYLRSQAESPPRGAVVRSGRRVEIRLAQPTAVSLDGEPAGITDCLSIAVNHRACAVVVPARRHHCDFRWIAKRGPGPA